MTGTTTLGSQAYELLEWMNDDLAARAPEAMTRVQELARQAIGEGSGQALIEVQDAGSVIRRLAGTIREPAALAGIAGQVIDMGRFDPARHPRGAHGQFIKSGTPAPAEGGGFAHAIAPQMAKGGREGFASALAPAMARGGIAEQMRPDAGGIIGSLQDRFGPPGPAGQVGKEDLAALEKRMRAEIQKSHSMTVQLKETIHEQHRAELAVELLTVAAGAALAFITGGGSFALAAVGPFLVKTAIDRGPEIAKALAKYHVVGKGHGRSFVAHPVAKTAVAAKKASAVTAQAARKVPVAVPALRRNKPVGLAGEDPSAASRAVEYVTGILTQGGMDPASAGEFATAAVKSALAKNWDLLGRVGASPAQLAQNLG